MNLFYTCFGLLLWCCFGHAYDPGTNITCTAKADSDLLCDGTTYSTMSSSGSDHDTGAALVVDFIVIVILVIIAGIMSGLTLGLLSLDTMNLEIIINAGDAADAQNAKKILPLVKRHHLLLVTLLLANAAAMETLPIFLDKMVPTWAAIVISVTLVLMFGEIIPQALCSRFGLKIGASFAYFVWGVMGLLFIIAWPISKVLDAILGAQHAAYFKKRGELRELLHLHGNQNLEHGILSVDETTIMKGALDMKEKTTNDVMTPLEKVFMLEVNHKLDQEVVQQIADSGRSRIPIYRETRDHIIGVLLVKSLLPRLLADHTATVMDDLPLRRLPTVSSQLSLYDLLNQFQTGKSHMAIVVSALDPMNVLGIVTLEDVIEELIQEEIYDEADLAVQQRAGRKLHGGLHSPPLGNSAHVHTHGLGHSAGTAAGSATPPFLSSSTLNSSSSPSLKTSGQLLITSPPVLSHSAGATSSTSIPSSTSVAGAAASARKKSNAVDSADVVVVVPPPKSEEARPTRSSSAPAPPSAPPPNIPPNAP